MVRWIVIMAVAYWVQAFSINPGIASLPLALYLKEDLGLDATAVYGFAGLVYIPWLLKPLFGWVVDGIHLFGYPTKGYFGVCYALAAALFLGLSGFQSYGFLPLLGAGMLISTCIAWSDVLADRLLVTEGKRWGAITLFQSAQWTTLGLSSAVTFLLGGWLAAHQPLAVVFRVSIVAPLIGLVVVVWLLPESRLPQPSFGRLWSQLWATCRSPSFLRVLGFMVLLGIIPLPPLLFYLRDSLKFQEEFIGILSAIQSLGMGLGAMLFGWLAPRCSRSALLQMIMGCSLLAMTSLVLMQDAKTALVVHAFSGGTGMMATLGIMDLAVLVCPVELAATAYALLLGVSNLAMSLGSLGGGWLYDQGIGFSQVVSLSAGLIVCCWGVMPLFKLKRIEPN